MKCTSISLRSESGDDYLYQWVHGETILEILNDVKNALNEELCYVTIVLADSTWLDKNLIMKAFHTLEKSLEDIDPFEIEYFDIDSNYHIIRTK